MTTNKSARQQFAALFCLILCTTLTFRCTNSNVVGTDTEGGSSIDVYAYRGLIYSTEGTPVHNATVSLKSILITSASDSITTEYTAKTDTSGYFAFDTLPSGDFVLYTVDSTKTTSGLFSHTELSTELSGSKDTLIIKKSTTVMGRILSNNNTPQAAVFVLIPGTASKDTTDSSGIYTLSNVPVGTCNITYIEDSIVNYLLISISESTNDTIHCKDVVLKTDHGTAAATYQPFRTTQKFNAAILPREYKPESEPLFYSGKDFGSIEYYAVQDSIKTIHTPSPKQILFISRLKDDDLTMIAHLEQNGYTVFTMRDDETTETDTAHIDLIYTSYSIKSASLKSTFKTTSVPLMTSEDVYQSQIGMAATNKQLSIKQLRIFDTSHVLAAGFKDLVTISSENVYTKFAKPPATATIIGVQVDDSSSVCLYAYNKGDKMVDIPAPGKRMGFFASLGCATHMSSDGWKLFDTAIGWMIED